MGGYSSKKKQLVWNNFVYNKNVLKTPIGIRVEYQPSSEGTPRIEGIQRTSSDCRNEITMEYDILFEDGFEWSKGGKLPGFRGGLYPATGCNQSRPDAWSFRLMWRRAGVVQLYIYDQTREGGCGVETSSIPNTFKIGEWMNIKMSMRLNSGAGKSDGEARLFIDGNLVLVRSGIPFRNVDDSAFIDFIFFSSFYGGNDSSWSPAKPTFIQFRNGVITNKLAIE